MLFWVRVCFGFWFCYNSLETWWTTKKGPRANKEQKKPAGRLPAFLLEVLRHNTNRAKGIRSKKESAEHNFGTNFWHNFLDTSLHTLHTRDTTQISPATDETHTATTNQHNHTHHGVIVKVWTPPEGFASHQIQVGHILATFFEACNAVRRP